MKDLVPAPDTRPTIPAPKSFMRLEPTSRMTTHITLELAWPSTKALSPADLPILQRFFEAVRDLAQAGATTTVKGLPALEAALATFPDAPAPHGTVTIRKLRDVERDLYAHAWQAAKGNTTAIALMLGVNRRTAYSKVRLFGLHP